MVGSNVLKSHAITTRMKGAPELRPREGVEGGGVDVDGSGVPLLHELPQAKGSIQLQGDKQRRVRVAQALHEVYQQPHEGQVRKCVCAHACAVRTQSGKEKAWASTA